MNILAAVEDVFFAAKLQAMARRAGVALQLIKSADALAGLKGEVFDILVVDLESRAFDPVSFIREMSAAWPSAARWAFAAHGHVELLAAARNSGWENTMARGAFEGKFPEFLAAKS